MKHSRKFSFFSFIPGRGSLQGWIGAALLLCIVLAVALAPLIAPYSQSDMLGGAWGDPGGKSLLGLDTLGRDMLTRLLYGGRPTLFTAIVGTTFAIMLGTSLGLAAAICGGKTDAALSRLVDAAMSIPPLICALVMLSVVGASTLTLVITITVLASTRVFRLSRSAACDISALEYFEAARLRRENMLWLMFREILPNIRPIIVTEFGLRLCSNFLLLSSLGFLGLGVQPPMTDWGSIVRENAAAIHFGISAPLYPAIAIALFTISANLIVDWFLERQSRYAGE
jgi:peptide/nickel transport system permease protein